MPPRQICKNKNQDSIMMEFMIANPDVVKGYAKGDRTVIAEKWGLLHRSLNLAGPPTKDLHSWRKIWSNRLSAIRLKLGKDPTGDSLTPTEKELATTCNLVIPRQGTLRSSRIKKEPETFLRRGQKNTTVKIEPVVENEILPYDDKENQWEDIDDTAAGCSSSMIMPSTSGPMSEMLKILQTMTTQQEKHFKEMEIMERRKLELTKTISQNIEKIARS